MRPIADRVWEYRQHKRMTQRALAKAIGTSQGWVSQLEDGRIPLDGMREKNRAAITSLLGMKDARKRVRCPCGHGYVWILK